MEMNWQTIDSAPKNGERLRLGHILDVHSMRPDALFKTYGKWVNDHWELSNMFICSDNFMRNEPTHWLSERE